MCVLDSNGIIYRNKKKLIKTLNERKPIVDEKISVYINRQGNLINKKILFNLYHNLNNKSYIITTSGR